MATSTIVITYTAATGEKDAKVTSMTVGGTAYASLTAANVRDTAFLLNEGAKLLRSDKTVVSAASPFTGESKGPTS
jgi:hypothetical protein